MMKRIFIIAALVSILAACSKTYEYRTNSGAVWGTTYHITYKGDRDLHDSIVKEMHRVEVSLSMFDKASLISRINAGLTDTVDQLVREVFDVAVAVNKASDGLFDPTVAPLTDLWGFGRRGRETKLPDSVQVAQALQHVGLSKCHIDGDRLVRDSKQMQFDFSAIAKGYGVDCVAAMLRRNGADDFMVEIGGEIALAGHNSRGEDWHIQVDAPTSDDCHSDALTMLTLTDCAIASSGNYRNYRMADSVTVIGHTIDPHTGYPSATYTIATTVIAPNCALADALATALMLVKPDSVARVLEGFQDTKAIIVTADGVLRIGNFVSVNQ